jgi:hypothetical protein
LDKMFALVLIGENEILGAMADALDFAVADS